MDQKQLKAALSYINANAAKLHGVPVKNLDVGGDITPENVVKANVRGTDAVLIVDRGLKGTPKYVIPVVDIEASSQPVKKVAAPTTKK